MSKRVLMNSPCKKRKSKPVKHANLKFEIFDFVLYLIFFFSVNFVNFIDHPSFGNPFLSSGNINLGICALNPLWTHFCEVLNTFLIAFHQTKSIINESRKLFKEKLLCESKACAKGSFSWMGILYSCNLTGVEDWRRFLRKVKGPEL